MIVRCEDMAECPEDSASSDAPDTPNSLTTNMRLDVHVSRSTITACRISASSFLLGSGPVLPVPKGFERSIENSP